MEHLKIAVRGIERELDRLHDDRARDRTDMDQMRSRIVRNETMIGHILARLADLEAGSPAVKRMEIVAPFILIWLAILYRVPLDQVASALGAIK